MNRIFFLAEPIGFYPDSAFETPPAAAVEISLNKYNELMELSSQGYEIAADEDGLPINLPKRAPTDMEISGHELTNRLTIAGEQVAILQPAVDGGYARQEHFQLLADWQRYRYELTLVSEQPGWPESPHWPAEPARII